jgi:uncharacterized repeat protein (TIGR01451 family)
MNKTMKKFNSSELKIAVSAVLVAVMLLPVIAAAHNTITKTTSTATVAPGGVATYTIKNDAAGTSSPVDLIQIKDTLPVGFTYLSTTSVTLLNTNSTRTAVLNPVIGDAAPVWGTFSNVLASGGVAAGAFQIVFNATVAPTTACGTYANTVTKIVNDPVNDHTNSNATNVANVTVAGLAPSLVVSKVANAPIIVLPSGLASYTLRVTNTAAAGSCPANGVTLTDALPAGFTYAATGTLALNGGSIRPVPTNPAVGATAPAWGGFTIPAGGSVNLTFTATVGSATAPGTYSNSASATTSATGATITPFNGATSTADDIIVPPTTASLTIRKSTNGAGTTGVSSPATFSFTTNNGGTFTPVATTAANTFVSAGTTTLTSVNTTTVITETLPAGGNWVMTGAICTDTNATASGNPANTNLATFNAVAGTVSLGATGIKAAAQIVCDITNTRRTLEVIKVVVKASTDLTDYRFDLLQNGTVQAANVGSGGTTTPLSVASGAVTFGEDSLAPNNSLSIFNIFWQCTNGDGTIVASSGGGITSASTLAIAFSGLTMPTNGTAASLAVTCTITNTRAALLTFIKSATPADGTSFAISSTFAGGPGQTANPTLAAGFGLTGIAPTNQISIDVLNNGTVDQRGTYTVTETLTAAQIAAGWDPTFIKITCQSNIVGANGITSSPTPPYSLAIPVTGSSRTVCTILNRKLGTVTVKKTLAPAADPGKFNLSVGATPVASAVGDSGSGAVSVLDSVPISIAESAVAPALLTNYTSSLSCIDAATSAIVGIASNVGTSGSITPAPGQNILCTFTNTKNAPTTATVTLAKTWAGASVNDAVSVTATGLTSLASIANTANETDTGAAQTVAVGSILTLGESFTTGVPANYSSSLACTGTTGLNASTGVLTVGSLDTSIVCTYTNIFAPVIVPVTESGSAFAGTPSTPIPDVRLGDKVNGVQATQTNSTVALSLTQVASLPAGLTLDPATGAIKTDATVPPGVYSIAYTLCDKVGPNCKDMVDIVTVTLTPLVATNDVFSGANGTVGNPNIGNALTNDTVNGAAATVGASGNAVLTVLEPATPTTAGAPVPTVDPATGIVSVPPGTPGGTYVIKYKLCEKLNPANCKEATITVPIAAIDTVKAVGVPKQIGPKVFEVSYSIVVANVCASAPAGCAGTPTSYNVQVNDNLKTTFPTATAITVSNYAVSSGANGAVCTPASTPFQGTAAASALFSGVNDLTGGQSCVATFKVTVDFGAGDLPTISQNNLAYASAVAADTVVNPGYTYAASGAPIAPPNAVATDISTSAPATSGPPGTLPATPLPPTTVGGDSAAGVPTPVIFAVQDDGELGIKKSTVTKITTAGEVVEYSVMVSNSGSSGVRTKVTDTPPVGFDYVAGSAKVNGASSSAPFKNGAELIFEIGTVPAKGSVELRYQMKLGDEVVGGEASNCVAAKGLSTLTGTEKDSAKSCASVIVQTGLFLEKRAGVKNAELGDSVEYALRVKSVGGRTNNVTISDKLPLGFKLIEGTVKLVRAGVVSTMVNPAGSPGPVLTYNVGTVANKEIVEIRYRVRLGIGADLGDGINRAQAKAPFATSSLEATAKVLVTRGVFTREACVAGKVFVDCNQNGGQDKGERNAIQDKGELGIPGVRLYMEDGTNITTDENGQYSICGVRAISHVMQVDTTTMPAGSRMGISSNRNLGDGVSLLMNIKAGELYRADFIEGSCTPSILEQVEQRIKSGVINVPLLPNTPSVPPKPLEFDSSQQGYSNPFLCTTQPDSIECRQAGGSK